jgi:hypothetical protein
MCKNPKFGSKKGPFDENSILIFLHNAQKMPIFLETWHVYIECQDVHARFFVWNFFNFLKIFFGDRIAYAPMC